MTTTTEATPSGDMYKLELTTAYGPVYRDVLRTPPRDCAPSEVPIIDLSGIYGDADARRAVAAVIREAAENMGFFYIKNHGIPKAVVDAARAQSEAFFTQPEAKKREATTAQSRFFNGWTEKYAYQISPTESRDHREAFMWRYDPRYDPAHAGAGAGADAVPAEVRPWLMGEEFVWEATAHLPGFKEDMLAYWRHCLGLARRLIRVFATALDLPETYFDHLVTFPGADGVVNYYPKNVVPPNGDGDDAAVIDVGIGAHTDLQSFTLLWQDMVGGLQVLTKEGQWVKVPPVEDTFVVNIGDFLMRLSNDRFKSTVHRVYNRAPVDRYSMPFFFGFNFNEECAVLPSCTSEGNPPKYEPITCGEASSVPVCCESLPGLVCCC